MLLDPFGRSQLPRGGDDFVWRVQQCDEVAEALLAQRAASPAAGLFVGGVFRSWLELGGDLQDHLQLRGRRGSHRTVSAVWHQMREGSSR